VRYADVPVYFLWPPVRRGGQKTDGTQVPQMPEPFCGTRVGNASQGETVGKQILQRQVGRLPPHTAESERQREKSDTLKTATEETCRRGGAVRLPLFCMFSTVLASTRNIRLPAEAPSVMLRTSRPSARAVPGAFAKRKTRTTAPWPCAPKHALFGKSATFRVPSAGRRTPPSPSGARERAAGSKCPPAGGSPGSP